MTDKENIHIQFNGKLPAPMFMLILISALVFIIICEKLPFDFRNKYLGNWEFDLTKKQLVYNRTQGFHDTIIYLVFHGEITYGSSHSKVKFNSDSYSWEYSIDKEGKIIPVNDYGPNYEESGGFEGRNIFKYYYYHHWGATRDYISNEIYGVRE